MSATVGVVGLGSVGARAARQLLERGHRVVVHDIRAGRRNEVLASLGDEAAALDVDAAAGPAPVAAALAAAGAGATVLAVPGGDHRRLAAELLGVGVPVVSTSDDLDDVKALLDLDAEAVERGLTVIVGAGFSPGLTCLLARHAGGALDRVEEVHVARVGTGGPACARQHHRALGGMALDWRDGGWRRREAGSGRELCWFPDPIGGRDCYRAALPDALLLVPALPDVRRVTARLAATRRDRLTSRLPMLRPPHPDGGPGGVRVEVRGMRDGGQEVLVYGAMDHPAVATAAVAAVAVDTVLAGASPGAYGLASVDDPLPLLRTLATQGIKAAAFTG